MTAFRAHAWLVVDIVSMKVFLWLLGQDAECLDAHLFFFDRYSALAEYYRQRGQLDKVEMFLAIAEAHYHAAPDDDEPPEAAALAMPVPRPRIFTNAVSSTQPAKPLRRPSAFQPSSA
jgi:hypothetical protein